MPTISIIVKGKVQGVFYRQSAKEKATDLKITGEVKNQPDETVFIIATGDQQSLDQFIAWCKKGPSRSVVTDVIVHKEDLKIFDTFNIIRSK